MNSSIQKLCSGRKYPCSLKTRNTKIALAVEYVKCKLKENYHPSYKELQDQFNIRTYRVKLRDIYSVLGVNDLNLKCKRPSNSDIKEDLTDYVKREASKGHYPSRRFIEHKFRLRFPDSFSISTLYESAGLKYIQKNSQEIRKKKATILQNLIIDLLPLFNLTLVTSRSFSERGIDLVTKDSKGKLVGIEIKANHKYELLKNRHLNQIERFICNENLSKVILVTTSPNKIDVGTLPIHIVDYNNLKDLCSDEQRELLEYVREETIHHETHEKEIGRQVILNYARDKIARGEDISARNICSKFKISVRTYFASIFEIYDALDVTPSIQKIGEGRRSNKSHRYKNIIVEEIVNYIKNEVQKGHYPSGIDVGVKFHMTHIWNFVTMTELYKQAGLPDYKNRKGRESKSATTNTFK